MDSTSSFSSSRGLNVAFSDAAADARSDSGETDTGQTDAGEKAEVDSGAGETVEETQPTSRISALNTRLVKLTDGTRTQVSQRTAVTRSQIAERTAAPRAQVAERAGDARSKVATLSSQRPELVVGVAFAGGMVIATILKRLARKQRTA